MLSGGQTGLPSTQWENVYKRERGQPPIHPRVIAALWLYGMMRKMRTSRILEYACRHNIDFIWLAAGHTLDHSKLAEFFTHNKKPLKSLFKQVCRMAMTMGLVRPGTVAFDATRVKAANSRFIVDSNVLGCINDTNELVAAVDRTTDMLGEKPDNVLTDSGNAAGSVPTALEDRNITAFAPAKSSEPAADSPVRREDLTQPVPESQWQLLKLSDRKLLDNRVLKTAIQNGGGLAYH